MESQDKVRVVAIIATMIVCLAAFLLPFPKSPCNDDRPRQVEEVPADPKLKSVCPTCPETKRGESKDFVFETGRFGTGIAC